MITSNVPSKIQRFNATGYHYTWILHQKFNRRTYIKQMLTCKGTAGITKYDYFTDWGVLPFYALIQMPVW